MLEYPPVVERIGGNALRIDDDCDADVEVFFELLLLLLLEVAVVVDELLLLIL